MSSPRSAPAPARRAALQPQRRPGKLRVAALLRAGSEVIAERGYEAATMAEIAARADAPIGSLYRFFPSKEALADALMAHYSELIDESFAKIEARRESSTTAAFADALLATMTETHGETKAAVVALSTRARTDRCAAASSTTECSGISPGLVRLRDPRLTARKSADMAAVLLQNMKAMKSLDPRRDAGTIAELRAMTRLYLDNKLSG